MSQEKPKTELLGRIGSALLPLEKLKDKSPRGMPFECEIHDFLLRNFNGYTVSSGTISGHWRDQRGKDRYGEHREYRVALPGRGSQAAFEAYLAGLAEELGEECIYLEVGSQVRLVYRSLERL